MTDCPRFQPLEGSPESMHLRYHGGALVAWVLWLARQWALRRASPRRWSWPGTQAPAVRRARLRLLLTGLIVLTVVLLTALWAPSRQAGNRPPPSQQPQKVALALA
jgi:hypothetical protein